MVTITELDPITKTIVGQLIPVMVENSITYTFTPAVQSCNEYSFQIQAENEAGTSGYSKAVSATLPIGEHLLSNVYARKCSPDGFNNTFHSTQHDTVIFQSHSLSGY
jgi:hypothetical protein